MTTDFTLRKRPMDEKYAIFHNETGHRAVGWLASRTQVVRQFTEQFNEPFLDSTNDEPSTMESEEIM